MPDTKQQKLQRMAVAEPLPPVQDPPQMSDAWKIRLPELAEEIDKLNEAWRTYFRGPR